MSVYYKKKIITLVFKSMSQAMLKISNVLFCVFTPRPSVQMKIERDHITLGGGNNYLSDVGEKKRCLPLEGNGAS